MQQLNVKDQVNAFPRMWFVFAAIAVLLLSASSAWAGAYVRVNQAGYVTGGPKRAYLMSTTIESGATFTVTDSSNRTALSAPIGSSLGSWGSYTVYPLDFDSVKTADAYTISVSGPATATSSSFKIDTGANLYSGALANALFFYQSQRDGRNFILSPLRTAGGHLNDASAEVFDANLTDQGFAIDAEGGWWDAGDYLKFVETTSYAEAVMLLGVRDFPNQMGPGSSTSNFTAEAQFGLDWLQKMWDDKNQIFYYQVGDGDKCVPSDHDLWRLPQVDDGDTAHSCISHRPVFLNPNGKAKAKISPNLAGRLAADFALCYQIFKNSNAAYANQCLLSAEHIFDLADTAPSGSLTTTKPFVFYGETEWRDDLELGATELYFALAGGSLPSGLPRTDPSYYLQQAATWAHNYITGPNSGGVLDLYDVSGLAHFELDRAITQANNPSGLAASQTDLRADLKKQLDIATGQAAKDPFGFGVIWNNDDTATHGPSLSIVANEYDYLTNTTTYANYATRWLGNILGANAWGASFIVGDGTVFPNCIQHQVANLVGDLNGGSPILKGALIEGPNSKGVLVNLSGMKACNQTSRFSAFDGNGAVFTDNVESFNIDEPAIDLTAPSMLAFSWQAGNPGAGATPDFSLSPTPASQTVVVGGSTSYTVNVVPSGGFTGTVNFAVSGLPTGATGSFNPASISGGSGTSTLSTVTSNTTPAGTYALTITGTSGSLSHSATATLVVNPAPVPDFALSASPSSLSVGQGSSNTSTITVTPQNGFGGSVSLTASGLPSGVTASFNPASATGTSVLMLNASNSATLGPATATITGVSGALTHSTTVSLTVVVPPTYSLSAGAANPASVHAGGSSTATVTVTPANGYTGSVTLSCAISPPVTPAPACSFGSTSPVSVTGSAAVTATLTFTTVAASAAIFRSSGMFNAMFLPITGLALVGIGFGSADLRRRRLSGFLSLGMVLAGLTVIAGCGSEHQGTPGTPPGTYTISITGKDSQGVTQTGAPSTVTVIVN